MITGGFGSTYDIKTGRSRDWIMGRDGVKRWADNDEPVEQPDLVDPWKEAVEYHFALHEFPMPHQGSPRDIIGQLLNARVEILRDIEGHGK